MDKETREFFESMMEQMNSRFENMEHRFDGMENEIKDFRKESEQRFNKLEAGQEEIKAILGELEPKNANRHLELNASIHELRKDLSTVEIVTASNYADIAKLKKAK